MVRVRKKGCGRSKEGGRGKVEWKDWWEKNWREDYATVLNISQSKKTSEKGGRTHQKRVGARNARCKAGRGGGPTCTTRTSPLMQKKKKETPQSILYYNIHRDEGVQEAGGGGEGDLKDAWEATEIGEFTQQCSVSPSSKTDASQSCK